MSETRVWVEAVLYGNGTHRRFTQDGPVLPDVWTEFLDLALAGNVSVSQSLLVEPHFDSTPAVVAMRMKDRLGHEFEATKTIYNRTIVSSRLTVMQLVHKIIPLTRWYADIAVEGPGRERSDMTTAFGALPWIDHVWDDVLRPDRRGYAFPKLLAFIRISGLIGFFALCTDPRKRDMDVEALADAVREMRSSNGPAADRARHKLAVMVLCGWDMMAPQGLPKPALSRGRGPVDESPAPVFAVNRNREVRFALNNSVKTVKADAATRLFEVDCSTVVWAVIDSGIDASHPAFVDHAALSDELGRAPTSRDIDDMGPARRLEFSRIVETYDFGFIEELLMGDTQNLPARYRLKDRQIEAASLKEIVTRIKRSRSIDWDLLKPFLRIEHDELYAQHRPEDGHGTHVAGILGADWLRGGTDRLRGMCPDIRLIDVRILGHEGRSSEFVIMSALQFIRYLNASSDKKQVHGINISLSLLHDAATYACGQTPVCEEAENTVSSGIVVVAAAGNLGYRRFVSPNNEPFDQYCPVSITDPGNAESVITVGSTHRSEPYTYGVSYFSSRGPTGDGRVKPDLVAPGEKIFSTTLDNSAVRLDGTSMAAPHVSGAAAMLMARNVELMGDPMRIKKILCATASDLGRERYFQGHGMLDVLRALQSI